MQQLGPAEITRGQPRGWREGSDSASSSARDTSTTQSDAGVATEAVAPLRQAYFDDFAKLSDEVGAWRAAGVVWLPTNATMPADPRTLTAAVGSLGQHSPAPDG